MILKRHQFESIIKHCLEELPNEACGLLVGKEGRVERVYHLTNADHSPVSYRLDPQEQYQVFMEMEKRGWELLGIYHSHVAAPPYPSASDIKQAYYPEALYLIVSLADRENPQARAFHIVEGQVTEAEFVVEE